MNIVSKTLVLVGLAASLGACSTVYPLGSVGKRAADPRSLKSDVRVDTSNRDVGAVSKLAWAAFGVSFDCETGCSYTAEEQSRIANEIAQTSFDAFDREMRKALGEGFAVNDIDETVRSPEFATEIKTDTLKSKVSRWFEKMNLSRHHESTATARGLKYLNPSELGWSGEKSLAKLGQSLEVDGVLVGHIEVTTTEAGQIVVNGPKVWIFSTAKAKPVAVATLKPQWSLEWKEEARTSLNWTGIEDVASGFSTRLAQAVRDL